MGRSSSEAPATASSRSMSGGTSRGDLGETLCRCLDESRSATASTTSGAVAGSSDGAESDVHRKSISGRASCRRHMSPRSARVASRTSPLTSSAISVPSPSAQQTRGRSVPSSMSCAGSRPASRTVPGALPRQCSTSARGKRAMRRSRSTSAPPRSSTSSARAEGNETPTCSSTRSVCSWMKSRSLAVSVDAEGRPMRDPPVACTARASSAPAFAASRRGTAGGQPRPGTRLLRDAPTSAARRAAAAPAHPSRWWRRGRSPSRRPPGPPHRSPSRPWRSRPRRPAAPSRRGSCPC